jgi:hypothetical protein
MDPLVEAALRKWPDVPHCWGWLALDARGDWYMRDERTQRAGPFARARGSRITHDRLKGFIERNYACDAQGQWYFQNGPQRVYLTLEATPWIWRLQWRDGALQLHSHTGLAAQARSSWLDETGRLYLDSTLGFGLVHSLDMLDAAQAVEAGLWTPAPLLADEAPQRFGFVRQPLAPG